MTELMTIDRHDSSKPVSFLEQGFHINILKSGEPNPVMIRVSDHHGFYVGWRGKCYDSPTSIKAVAKAQEWLGYEHLSFHVVFDEPLEESPD